MSLLTRKARRPGPRPIRVERLEDRAVPAGDFGSVLTAGGPGRDGAADVATDAAGNVYVVGGFADTVDFDPGPGTVALTSTGFQDGFVTRYTPDGRLAWAHAAGDGAAGVAADAAGNVYVTGVYTADTDFDPGPGQYVLPHTGRQSAFVLALDPAGNLVWAAGLTGVDTYVAPAAVAVDAAGAVFVAGEFSGAADFDPGPGTFPVDAGTAHFGFVLKLDPGGGLGWAAAFRTNKHVYPRDIAVDANGVYTTGFFAGGVDFDPGPGLHRFVQANVSSDYFVSKLNPDGTFGWAGQVGTLFSRSAWGSGIAVDGAGNVFTTGEFLGTHDFDPGPGTYSLTSQPPLPGEDPMPDMFVSKLDAAGRFVWARQIGGRADEWGTAIALDPAGNIYTAGIFSGTTDFDEGPAVASLSVAGDHQGVFVAKLDPEGYYRWARQLGRGGDASASALAVSGTGDVYTAGWFEGAVDFDPGPGTARRTSAPSTIFWGTDVYVSKLVQQPPGPLTYTARAGNGADALVLRRRRDRLELFDARAGRTLAGRHFDEVTAVVVTGADGETDTLTVDYSGGLFRPPGGVTFHGGAGGRDVVRVRGADTGYVLTDAGVTGGNGVAVALTGVEAAELTGGAGDNVLDATVFAGHALLDGGAGADVLRGARGGSLLRGGAGNDTLDANGASAIAAGGGGRDTLVAVADADFTLRSLPLGRAELKVTAPDATVLAVQLLSGVERAALTGGAGANVLDTGRFPGSVTLAGGSGHDRLAGGPAADVLDGGDGDDSLTGGRGNDQLDGGPGTDVLIEADDAHFSLSAARLVATSPAGAARGTDVLVGIDQAWLTGGAGANRLDAAQFGGRVTLDGGKGADVLVGGSAADVLIGGAGTDQVTGGAGADTFSAADPAVEFLDFNAGEGDAVV
jgi:Ca2+-binding RTX toxin-like protein